MDRLDIQVAPTNQSNPAKMGWVHTLNEKVADSQAGRYFELRARKSTFSTEVRKGQSCADTSCLWWSVSLMLPCPAAAAADTDPSWCRVFSDRELPSIASHTASWAMNSSSEASAGPCSEAAARVGSTADGYVLAAPALPARSRPAVPQTCYIREFDVQPSLFRCCCSPPEPRGSSVRHMAKKTSSDAVPALLQHS